MTAMEQALDAHFARVDERLAREAAARRQALAGRRPSDQSSLGALVAAHFAELDERGGPR